MKKGFMKWMLFSIASLILSSCNGNTSNNSTIKEWKDDSIDDVVYDENGNPCVAPDAKWDATAQYDKEEGEE